MNTPPTSHTWIIGASSGMGAALAKQLSERGERLILSARTESALITLNNSLGGGHIVLPFDVQDSAATLAAGAYLKEHNIALTRVLFMAALYTPMKLAHLDLMETQRIVNVNLMGAFNVVAATLPVLLQQGTGQLALCASVAGYNGLPNSQPYAATKAALINLAESLYIETRGTGVDVKVICPGFVETPLTAKNTFPMPFIMSADKAAARIVRGLNSRAFDIHFPKRLSVFLKVLRLLPFCVRARIMKKVA